MCELKKAIIQFKLNLRKLQMQQEAQEAAQEAAGAEMIRIINIRSAEHNREKEAAEALQRRQRQEERRRAARKERNRKRAENWAMYIRRIGICVIVAAVAYILDAAGAIAFPLALSVMILCGVFCIVNYAAYTTRNRKSGNRKAVQAC